jgi:hypothetical protein
VDDEPEEVTSRRHPAYKWFADVRTWLEKTKFLSGVIASVVGGFLTVGILWAWGEAAGFIAQPSGRYWLIVVFLFVASLSLLPSSRVRAQPRWLVAFGVMLGAALASTVFLIQADIKSTKTEDEPTPPSVSSVTPSPSPSPRSSIVSFLVLPDSNLHREVAPDTFVARDDDAFYFWPRVRGSSGPIRSRCTFNWRIYDEDDTPVDSGSGDCFNQRAGASLRLGSFRLEGEVFLPDTDEKATTTLAFTIVP